MSLLDVNGAIGLGDAQIGLSEAARPRARRPKAHPSVFCTVPPLRIPSDRRRAERFGRASKNCWYRGPAQQTTAITAVHQSQRRLEGLLANQPQIRAPISRQPTDGRYSRCESIVTDPTKSK